jgi:hypothetical protein
MGNSNQPIDVTIIIDLMKRYNLPFLSLLNTIINNSNHIVSKYTFDRYIQHKSSSSSSSPPSLCLKNIYIGHKPSGFLYDDFLTRTQKNNYRYLLKKQQLLFKRFLLNSLLLNSNNDMDKEPAFYDGLLFLTRKHNRKYIRLPSLISKIQKIFPVLRINTFQPQCYSFRTMIEELRRVSMVSVVSGAGVTNLMFMRSNSVVLFSMPLGCYGFT